MPFMKGIAPVRRTLKYLENSPLTLKDRVQVLAIHHHRTREDHKAAREFVLYDVPQLQYKNPGVQIVTLKDLTPTPFIRIFCNNGEDILMDIDGKERKEIREHLLKVICKSAKAKQVSEDRNKIQPNPAHFGWGCERQCICEVVGQVPCPAVVPLPRVMRGKYFFNPQLLEELEENEKNQ